ncbi:DNA-binding protein YbiB [Chitinasiproducens palmae]|nr:DNA-binding protein YbiB [Chitinasiproducens palmae]
MTEAAFSCAPYIKEIGRGARGARALSGDDAARLFDAMLSGQVGPVETGAIVMAYRIKGEAPEELAGMLRAAHAHLTPVAVPAGAGRAVAIPSYNGARKQPNLTPLLALLLAREGVPVLVHGVGTDPGRVTSADIFSALGHPPVASTADAAAALTGARLAFLPIEALSPALAGLLALRRTLGVRNSAHTIVKLLQPFDTPGLRLVNYTHPPYRDSLAALFAAHAEVAQGDVLLARGTEGEAVADTRRQVQVDWFRDGQQRIVAQAARVAADPTETLPACDAQATAGWIADVLAGRQPVPASIARQVEAIVRIVRDAAVGDSPSPAPVARTEAMPTGRIAQAPPLADGTADAPDNARRDAQ